MRKNTNDLYKSRFVVSLQFGDMYAFFMAGRRLNKIKVTIGIVCYYSHMTYSFFLSISPLEKNQVTCFFISKIYLGTDSCKFCCCSWNSNIKMLRYIIYKARAIDSHFRID